MCVSRPLDNEMRIDFQSYGIVARALIFQLGRQWTTLSTNRLNDCGVLDSRDALTIFRRNKWNSRIRSWGIGYPVSLLAVSMGRSIVWCIPYSVLVPLILIVPSLEYIQYHSMTVFSKFFNHFMYNLCRCTGSDTFLIFINDVSACSLSWPTNFHTDFTVVPVQVLNFALWSGSCEECTPPTISTSHSCWPHTRALDMKLLGWKVGDFPKADIYTIQSRRVKT